SGSYRCVWDLLDERIRNLMDVREDYFDGLATEAEFDSALKASGEVPHQLSFNAWNSINPQRQVQLLRDLFGNPFRPVSLCPEWRTKTIVSLATQMYDRGSSARCQS